MQKISIKNLRPADVGKFVIYTDGVGEQERGRIKSWNDSNVFVVFKCGGEWSAFADYTGQPCNPKNLHFEKATDRRDHCAEHRYLPYGKYQGGVQCQFCLDEIGTKW